MHARPALEEARTSDDAPPAHPEPLHDRQRGMVVHLGERDDLQVRLVLGGPRECCPAELCRIAATGAGVATAQPSSSTVSPSRSKRVKPPRPTRDLSDRSRAIHVPTPSAVFALTYSYIDI